LYLAAWQQFATERPLEWLRIFETNGQVRQRAASVAASFMVFMGCSGGACFTARAAKLWKSGAFDNVSSAFVAAWALENRRHRGVNHGLRTIEFMLAREHPIVIEWSRQKVNWKQVPAITMEDNDIIESMVVWWSSSTAELMREMVDAQHIAHALSAQSAQAQEGAKP